MKEGELVRVQASVRVGVAASVVMQNEQEWIQATCRMVKVVGKPEIAQCASIGIGGIEWVLIQRGHRACRIDTITFLALLIFVYMRDGISLRTGEEAMIKINQNVDQGADTVNEKFRHPVDRIDEGNGHRTEGLGRRKSSILMQ